MLLFSEKPGRRERHLLRQRNNPLYSEDRRKIASAALQEAQRLDHEEIVGFLEELQTLVQQAMNLAPNEQSDVILGLKERLDQAYEQACGLGDDQDGTKQGLRHLTAAVMQAVRRGAEGDPLALRELEDEQTARELHYQLLEQPLVADLLHPDSPIEPGDLAPTLLCCSEAELDAVLDLFDGDQLALLIRDAEALLDTTPEAPEDARHALERMRQAAG